MLALRPTQYMSYGVQGSSTPFAPRQSSTWLTPPPAVAEKRPSLWDWYKTLQEPQPPGPMESAVQGLRHNAEGAAVGAVLGFVDGEFGLDIQGKYPIDGILAFLLYLWSVRDAGKPDGFASDLRALSQSCSTVFTFRKTKDWREGVKSKTIPRNSDPILAAGESIGVKTANK